MGRCHTFLFADLVGFTAYTEAHGDEAAADVAVRFVVAAGELAREHGADLVKCLGDGVMLRCGDAARAVRLGLALQDELAVDLPVAVGAHTGCAVERGGDWFGSVVNLAARLSDSARGGELLVTAATAAAAGAVRGVELASLGPQLFRNVAEPVEVLSARRRAAHPEPARSLGLSWGRPAAEPATA
jgi:adenylate cyclase